MSLTQIDDRGLKTPIDLLDNEKIRFGTGNDLELFHDGTDSKIFNHTGTFKINANDFLFKDKNEGDTFAKFIHDGAVELYYDSSSKFETFSWGARVHGNLSLIDNKIAYFGTNNDLQIYHDGGNSWVKEAGTGALYIDTDGSVIALTKGGANETLAKFYTDGAVELYYDNKKSLETRTDGVSIKNDNTETFRFTGNILSGIADNSKIYLGAGDDLQIYHDGSNSYIKDAGTGHLSISSDKVWIDGSNNESMITATENGAVELYFDGSKKFETTSTGVQVTGNIDIDGNIDAADGSKIKLGTGDDFQLYHDGNNSVIKDAGTGHLNIHTSRLQVTNAADNEGIINGLENGSVELYYDGSKKLNTESYGTRGYSNLKWGYAHTTAPGSVSGNQACGILFGTGNSETAIQANSHDTTTCIWNRTNGNGVIVEFEMNGNSVGSISTNTNAIPSDRNYKRDISDLNLGLSLVNKLKPSQYRWKHDPDNVPIMYGLIAQDIEESLTSEGITKNSTYLLQHNPTEESNKSDYDLDYTKLIPILINSIKELSTKVAALENA